MDHATMDHGTMDMTPLPQGPPPASAGSGPPRAADAIWGADAMRASRSALRTENGGMNVFWFQGDRIEYRAREGGDGRSEEHTSELQSLMRISYAVLCLTKKTKKN